MRRFALAATLLPLLAGCSQIAEPRVRAALQNAGLNERMSACMAERMVDRLSIGQLRKLEALSGMDRQSIGRMSLPDFVSRVQRVGDPEVLAVVTSSAAGCALR